MKNFLQDDAMLTLPAPADVEAGEFVKSDMIYGFAQSGADAGDPVAITRRGVFSAAKASGTALALGAALEYDAGNSRFRALASGDHVATVVAAAPSGQTVVEVVLV